MVNSIFILLCSFIWQNLNIYKDNVYQLAKVWKSIIMLVLIFLFYNLVVY